MRSPFRTRIRSLHPDLLDGTTCSRIPRQQGHLGRDQAGQLLQRVVRPGHGEVLQHLAEHHHKGHQGGRAVFADQQRGDHGHADHHAGGEVPLEDAPAGQQEDRRAADQGRGDVEKVGGQAVFDQQADDKAGQEQDAAGDGDQGAGGQQETSIALEKGQVAVRRPAGGTLCGGWCFDGHGNFLPIT